MNPAEKNHALLLDMVQRILGEREGRRLALNLGLPVKPPWRVSRPITVGSGDSNWQAWAHSDGLSHAADDDERLPLIVLELDLRDWLGRLS